MLAEGATFAHDTACMLCERGLTVIAGLAEGVDSFAHRATLEAGGRTVAFIGTGINRCYPASNRELQKSIEKRGLVLPSSGLTVRQPNRHSRCATR